MLIALIALAMAAAYPMTHATSREHASSVEYVSSVEVVMMNATKPTESKVVTALPTATFTGVTSRGDTDVGQTGAMMLVGSLLIGIGSVVRRVV